MVLNKLKKIRDELKESAKSYDEAFKNTALIAAESLVSQQKLLDADEVAVGFAEGQRSNFDLNHSNQDKILAGSKNQLLSQILTKEYFLEQYGSLKNTKEAYRKVYGKKKYGKSWQDFLAIAAELPLIEKPALTLEERVERIENILKNMGYKL